MSAETKPEHPDYDVFISYATDDIPAALEARKDLKSLGLAVFLDVPGEPSRTPFQYFTHRLRGNAKGSLPPAKVKKLLRSWLNSSDCILLLWSRSHRGSRWAGEEIDIFETEHATRPIFVWRLDDTHFEPPSSQFIELRDTVQRSRTPALTRERIQELTGREHQRHQNAGSVRRWDVLLHPENVRVAAQRLRSGTTLPELLALWRSDRKRKSSAAARAEVGRAVWSALLGVLSFAAMVAALALIWASSLPPERVVPRELLLLLGLIWVCVPVFGVQTSLLSLAPATLWATTLGFGTEVWLGQGYTGNMGGGWAAGATLGAFAAWIASAERFFQRQQLVSRYDDRAWHATVIGTVIVVVSAIAICSIDEVQDGTLTGSALALVLTFLVALPTLALWRELAALARVREIVWRGIGITLLLVGLAGAIGVSLAVSELRINQNDARQGFVTGVLIAICTGVAFCAPSAFLSPFSSAYARARSSLISVAVTLFVLWPVFARLAPGSSFNADLRAGCLAFVLSGGLSWCVALAWYRHLSRRCTPEGQLRPVER